MAACLRLLALIAAFATCCGFHVALPMGGSPRCGALARSRAPLRMAEEADEAAPSAPAEEPAPAAPPAQTPPMEPYDMPTKFMGVFDTSSPEGALGASIIVSLLFGVGVEFVKFLDPNNVGDASIFGSLATIGK